MKIKGKIEVRKMFKRSLIQQKSKVVNVDKKTYKRDRNKNWKREEY